MKNRPFQPWSSKNYNLFLRKFCDYRKYLGTYCVSNTLCEKLYFPKLLENMRAKVMYTRFDPENDVIDNLVRIKVFLVVFKHNEGALRI